MHQMHHSKSDVNRFYLPREEGVGDLYNLNYPYLFKQHKWLDAHACKQHEQIKRMHSITSDAKKIFKWG